MGKTAKAAVAARISHLSIIELGLLKVKPDTAGIGVNDSG
jgi:hypothetical protein